MKPWTAKELNRVLDWWKNGVSLTTAARRLGRTESQVRCAVKRHKRRTGATGHNAARAAGLRRRAAVRRAVADWPTSLPRTLAELARRVGSTPRRVKGDLAALGLGDWLTADRRAAVYRGLGRAANRERWAKERAESLRLGWPPVPSAQRHWLAVLVSKGGATLREWAAAVGRTLTNARNRRSASALLVKAGYVTGRWEGKNRYVYRPAGTVLGMLQPQEGRP